MKKKYTHLWVFFGGTNMSGKEKTDDVDDAGIDTTTIEAARSYVLALLEAVEKKTLSRNSIDYRVPGRQENL